MKHKTWILAFSVALAGVVAARADAAEPGFYLSAALGQADEDPESVGTNVGNSLGIFHVDPQSVEIDDGSVAWGVGVGYRLNRYLAAEVEYIDFGTTDIVEHYSVPNMGPIPFPTEFDKDYSSRVTGPAMSVVGTLPIGERVELFVRGGALFASRHIEIGSVGTFDEKFASTVWLAGAGVSWSFAQHWGVRAEYQLTDELDENIVAGETRVKRLSLGVLFRF
jgi:opacity protein-like surface antigen